MSSKENRVNENERIENLKNIINELPRVQLAHLPTPLEKAPKLSQAIGGTRVLFKRDDLTGLPLSGNKTRMFEFSLAKAVEQKAEVVVQSNAAQSNYSRQLALACAKLGLDVHLVLRSTEKELLPQGNLLLDLLSGAEVELVEADVSEQPKLKREKVKELTEQGKKVYEARGSDHDTALEAVAYVKCALEIFEQINKMDIEPDYLFVCSHDTTQAGLIVGTKYLDCGFPVIGINMFNDDSRDLILRIAQDVVGLLNLDMKVTMNDVINTQRYVGEGYGIPTKDCLESIKLCARTEGICLDPVYTGKALAGLIDYVERGEVEEDDTVLFLHTGGFPALFAYNQELMDVLEKPTLRETSS